MSSHPGTTRDQALAMKTDDESAISVASTRRAESLELWRARVFLDIRSYHYTTDRVWSCIPASLLAGTVMIPWYFTSPDIFPRAQDFALYAFVLGAIGVVLALSMELRSTTSSTSLTINRFVGSIILSLYAGGLQIAFIQSVLRNMKLDGSLLILEIVLALIFYFMLNFSGFFVFVIALVGLSKFEPRVPGLISARSKEMLPGALWGKIRKEDKVWKKREYMHALAMHEHFREFEALWEHEDLSVEALEISVLQAFERMEDDALVDLLQRMIPSLQKPMQTLVLNVWKDQPDRQRWARAILTHSMYQVEADTARIILLAQLEDEQPGAERAALTTLKSARINLHDEAIAYLEKFAKKEHATAIYDIKQASKNPLLTSRLGKLLEALGARLDGAHGKLSLAQDDATRGGLTSVDGEET